MKKETEEKLKRLIENSIPLKNDIFMIFASSIKFCEEFLRTILKDEKLIVLENNIQKILPSAFNKNVVLDMLCKLKDGRIVNVEIQLAKEICHAKRILTYASKIRVNDFGKGENYNEVSDIIIIYLTLEDIFKKGNTVYEVKMDVVSDTNETVEEWAAGLKVYYVNTEGLTNKTINEYLKLLTDKTTLSNKYVETSRIKESLYNQKGDITMSKEMATILDEVRNEAKEEWMQKGIQQGIQQGEIDTFIRIYKNGLFKADEAARLLNISCNEFMQLVDNSQKTL